MMKHKQYLIHWFRLVGCLVVSIGIAASLWLTAPSSPPVSQAQSPLLLPKLPDTPSENSLLPVISDEVEITYPRAPTATPTRILDDEPPVTTLSITGTYNANGWTQSPVTITFDASDNLTGLGLTWYKVATESEYHSYEYYYPPIVFATEGKILYYYSQDTNHNMENVHTATVNIDMTAPTVSHTITGDLLPNGSYSSPVTVVFNGQDNLSGISQFFRIDG